MKGSTASVDSAASWLRDSLKVRVDDASEDVIAAKRMAERHWEGRSGTAYVGYAKEIITVTDAHVDRIETAAGKVEAYSVRLRQAKEQMKALRDEARQGGLDVVDTVIQVPSAALAPTPPALDATDRETQRFAHDMGAFQAQVDKVELYNRILEDVEREWSGFVAWIDSHLKSVPETLEAPEVDAAANLALETVGNLGIALGLTLGERHLEKKSDAMRAQVKELQAARRSGDPSRRARGTAPDTPSRIRDLNKYADWAGRGGKVLGPAGATWDTYQALEDESPGGALVGVGLGAVATAVVIFTAPVSVPTIAVLVGSVFVGAGASWLVTESWEAAPDDLTEPVDDWVAGQWDDTKDVASDGWNTVKGWF